MKAGSPSSPQVHPPRALYLVLDSIPVFFKTHFYHFNPSAYSSIVTYKLKTLKKKKKKKKKTLFSNVNSIVPIPEK